MEFQDTLADEGPNPETLTAEGQETGLRRRLLVEALDALPDRDREIFVERRLKDDPVTLEELGQRYGVSRERVRQLENRAFERVQKAVTEAMETLEADPA